jgi:hypothetical protein
MKPLWKQVETKYDSNGVAEEKKKSKNMIHNIVKIVGG